MSRRKTGAQPSVAALSMPPPTRRNGKLGEAIGHSAAEQLPTRGITLVLPDEAVCHQDYHRTTCRKTTGGACAARKCVRGDHLAAANKCLSPRCRSRQQLSCALPAARKRSGIPSMTDRLGCTLEERYRYMAGRLKLSACMQSMHGKTCIWLCLRQQRAFSCWSRNASTVIPAVAVFSVSRARWISH